MKIDKKKRNLVVICSIFIIFALTFFMNEMIFSIPSRRNNTFNFISPSGDLTYNKQWLNNTGFDTEESWYNSTLLKGDPKDVNASISNNYGNFNLKGEQRKFSIQALETNQSKWEPRINPEFPAFPEYPAGGSDQYFIDDGGFWTRHRWAEGPKQTPSVQWTQLVELPVNMSDYIITSANVSAIVNASVDRNIDVNHISDTPEGSNNDSAQGVVYDYVKFYVRIADPNYNNIYEIAYNKTKYLGLYNSSEGLSYLEMDNIFMKTIPEKNLLFYLSSILSDNNCNFTIILGIDIFCEDNCHSDQDYWEELRIKDFSLNFTYEKKIDKETTISWNQDAKKISEDIKEDSYNYFTVDEAILNLSYLSSPKWPEASPNSEIRIILNGKTHNVPLKLINVSETPQDISLDVAYLINDDVNLSIQLYIADEFGLDEVVTVSIDNVTLEIEYTVYFDDYITNTNLLINNNPNQTQEYPINRNLIFNLTYWDNASGEHISNASVSLTANGNFIDNFEENISKEYYYLNINTTEDLDLGINTLVIEASKNNYETQEFTRTLTIRKINAGIFRVNGPKNLNISTGDDLYLEVNVTDTDNNELIKNATVTYIGGFGSGVLLDSNNDGIYNGTIYEIPEGYFNIEINAFGLDDYSFQKYIMIINSTTPPTINTTYTLKINNIELTEGELFEYPIGTNLTLILEYRNGTNHHLSNASVTIRGDYIGSFEENVTGEYYYHIINTTQDLDLGDNILNFKASIAQHEPQEFTNTIRLRKINTEIKNQDGKNIQIFTGNDLELNIILNDTDNNETIKGATVTFTGDFGSGVLTDPDNNGIYNITINNIQDDGFIYINWTKPEGYYDFSTETINVDALTPSTINTISTLYLNGNNVTDEGAFEFPIGTGLYFKLEYTNKSSEYVPDANVIIDGDFTVTFQENETGRYYYTYINTTTDLELGINTLQIEASKTYYESKSYIKTIEIRKINTTIERINGPEAFQVLAGEEIYLEIQINDTDNNVLVKNATVTYKAGFGNGLLEDSNDDGIYNTTIYNIPAGEFTIKINAIAEGNYQFHELSLDVDSNIPPIINTTYSLKINNEEITQGELVEYPIGTNITLILEFMNESQDHISGAIVSISGDYIGQFTENETGQYYYLNIISSEEFDIGDNTLNFEAVLANYETQSFSNTIRLREIETNIKRINGPQNVQIYSGEDIYLEIIVNDTDNNLKIKNATVTYSGDFGDGILTDSNDDGIYNGTITEITASGLVTINAIAQGDYSFEPYSMVITSNPKPKINTTYSLFINNEQIPKGELVEFPIGTYLKFILHYTNESEEHVPGAVILISGDYIRQFSENNTGEYYFFNINTTEELDLGDNTLNFEASLNNYQNQEFTNTIRLRPLKTEIKPYEGIDNFDIQTGQDIKLQIIINDTDNDELIKDATVTYTWEKGSGVLRDENNDGIYEAAIKNFPSGGYTIKIDAIAQGDYSFESYEITVTATTPEPFNYLPIVIGLVGGIVGLSSYFVLYQTRLKYPPVVRKLRKLRKKISKGKKPKSTDLSNRQNLVNSILKEKMDLPEPKPEKDKMKSITPEISKNNDELSKGGD